MIARITQAATDRLTASDPGLVRLRLGFSAVLSIIIAVLAILPLGQPLTVTLVAAIAAMTSAFTVTDATPGARGAGKEAVTPAANELIIAGQRAPARRGCGRGW